MPWVTLPFPAHWLLLIPGLLLLAAAVLMVAKGFRMIGNANMPGHQVVRIIHAGIVLGCLIALPLLIAGFNPALFGL